MDDAQAVAGGRVVAVMQPYFLPYLPYFHLLHAADLFVVYDDVQFMKGGWINRNSIMIGGAPQRFTLPLSGASMHRRIDEVTLAGGLDKLARTFRQGYARAPFADETLTLLDEVLTDDEPRLARFIERSIRAVGAHLGTRAEIVRSSDLEYDRSLSGADRLLGLLRNLGATRYVNSPGGRELYDAETFRSVGIELLFIESTASEYPQGTEAFLPGLSIVDALMRVGATGTRERVASYDLV